MKLNVIPYLIVILIFASGCISQPPEEYNESEINDITEEAENNTIAFEKDIAITACGNLCKDFLSEGVDLSIGPCLSDNNADWNVDDWVCDVAHSPRQGIDDLSQNQCQSYSEGQAHHFVEVDENCDLIRAV
jgi:hypothetical protein